MFTKVRNGIKTTCNILPLSGLATLTGQRTLTVFKEPVSGWISQFISNTIALLWKSKKRVIHFHK